MFDDRSDGTVPQLMTIGYEGSELEDFIATLRAAGVKELIDVRELPLSRKKGFSKTALREAVENAGLSYIHVRQLGDPKPGREAAKAGDFETFLKIFGEHMNRDETKAAINSLVPIISRGGSCLLCFERSHSYCHRSIVAEELARKAEIGIRHIGVVRGIADKEINS